MVLGWSFGVADGGGDAHSLSHFGSSGSMPESLHLFGFRAVDGPARPPAAAWQQVEADRVGLPWPRPKRPRGQPSHKAQWQRLLYAELDAGRGFGEGIGSTPPPGWSPKKGLVAPGVRLEDVEVAAAVVPGVEKPDGACWH